MRRNDVCRIVSSVFIRLYHRHLHGEKFPKSCPYYGVEINRAYINLKILMLQKNLSGVLETIQVSGLVIMDE